jgi:hypothetical protein
LLNEIARVALWLCDSASGSVTADESDTQAASLDTLSNFNSPDSIWAAHMSENSYRGDKYSSRLRDHGLVFVRRCLRVLVENCGQSWGDALAFFDEVDEARS